MLLIALYLGLLFNHSQTAFSTPIKEMKSSFQSLMKIMPLVWERKLFIAEKNHSLIKKELKNISDSFKKAKHDNTIKQDLFNPSYQLLEQNLKSVGESFQSGKKVFSHWLLQKSLSACIECHSRLPEKRSSSFQNQGFQVDSQSIKDPYDRAIIYLLTRKYETSVQEFKMSLQNHLIKNDSYMALKDLKHILMIQTKIYQNPHSMLVFIGDLLKKKDLPPLIRNRLTNWTARLSIWVKTYSSEQLAKKKFSMQEIKDFLSRWLKPIEKKAFYQDQYEVDLLLCSGVLSKFFYQYPKSELAAQLGMWIGKIENRLNKEEYFSSGDLFLKQCIKKYPKSQYSKKCFKEYKENIIFQFTGSAGETLPIEVKKELKELKKLISP